MKTKEEKQAAVELRRKERENKKSQEKIEDERGQRPVESITISIEWKKSRMWGSNPHATAEVRYRGESYPSYERRDGFTCSGCGYDKESTVVSEIYNEFLKYKLWQFSLNAENRIEGAPYGVSSGQYEGNEYRYYSGGIGTNCYHAISAFIGGQFKTVASGNTFDVFEYKDLS
jgi:hypothetical protein